MGGRFFGATKAIVYEAGRLALVPIQRRSPPLTLPSDDSPPLNSRLGSSLAYIHATSNIRVLSETLAGGASDTREAQHPPPGLADLCEYHPWLESYRYKRSRGCPGFGFGTAVMNLRSSSLLLLAVAIVQTCGAIYDQVSQLPTHDYDYIIVGGTPSPYHELKRRTHLRPFLGGTAGNVVANRLTENSNVHVLILEAGGR